MPKLALEWHIEAHINGLAEGDDGLLVDFQLHFFQDGLFASMCGGLAAGPIAAASIEQVCVCPIHGVQMANFHCHCQWPVHAQ